MDYLIISLFGAGAVLTALLFWWARHRSWTAKSKWPAPDEGDEPLAPIVCAVAGTTRTALSGHRRQHTIAKLRVGEPIFLIHQPYDLKNPDNVSVFTERGTDIGELPGEVASRIAPLLDEEQPITVTVRSLEPIDLGHGRKALEVQLEITRYRKLTVANTSPES